MPPLQRTYLMNPYLGMPDRGSLLTNKALGIHLLFLIISINTIQSLIDLICLLTQHMFPTTSPISAKDIKHLLRYLLHKSKSSIGILILAIFYYLNYLSKQRSHHASPMLLLHDFVFFQNPMVYRPVHVYQRHPAMFPTMPAPIPVPMTPSTSTQGHPSPKPAAPIPQQKLAQSVDVKQTVPVTHQSTVAPPTPSLLSHQGIQLFLSSLIVANKFLKEPSPSNKAWSKIKCLPSATYLSQMERSFLAGLGYELFVDHKTFMLVCEYCLRLETVPQ